VKFILRGVAALFCLFLALLFIAMLLPDTKPAAVAAMPAAAPVSHLSPHEAALQSTTIAKYHGRKDELGMVLYETFTVRNDGAAAVKDLKIKCENEAPSGTTLDSNTRTIYEIVPAHRSRTFANFNMGFVDPQTSRSGCQIEDLTLAESTNP
jgi:hypothetical protein